MTALRTLLLPLLAIAIVLPADAQSRRPASLHESLSKNGTVTLGAFEPVVESMRASIVRLEIRGAPVALGTVVTAEGGVLTKASELTGEPVTAVLADGRKAIARTLAVAEDSDLALLQIDAAGLIPVTWSSEPVHVGQWAVTPGVQARPEAIGVISTAPRRILHARALIGVQLDLGSEQARISELVDHLGAEQAGLLAGDIILSVDGEAVGDGEALMKALREFRAGQTVTLRVQRDGERFEVNVPLMPPSAATRGSRRRGRMERMSGEVSSRADGFTEALQHDSVLQPWQCGGPLLNVEGEAIGLNIARAGRVASYALPAELVRQILAQLQAEAFSPVAGSR